MVANRCDPAQLTAVAEALKRLASRTYYVLPEEPLLVAPSVAELRERGRAGPLISGDAALLGREAMGVLVAGMTAEHVLERLTEGMAVITPGDRSDVVLAVVERPCGRRLSVAVVRHPQRRPRTAPVDRALVAGLGLRLPIVATDARHLRNGQRAWRRRGAG